MEFLLFKPFLLSSGTQVGQDYLFLLVQQELLYGLEYTGNTQGMLFCTALALVVVGISGCITLLGSFLTE